MKKKMDDTERIIEEELRREADRIEQEAAEDPPRRELTAAAKVRMRANIDTKIEQHEKETVYARLSEEDRKALEIGREVLKERTEKPAEVTVVRKKRSWRMYVGLAAVLVMVLAVGMTSIGGPDRIIRFFTQSVGEREVQKVNSGDTKTMSDSEREEEAYQKIRDEFGIDPVKIIWMPEGMRFKGLESDQVMQTAEMVYTYSGKNVSYYMSFPYADSSWATDVEDKLTDEWLLEVSGIIIEMKEYETPETREKRYAAKFTYKKVEYFLNGTMERENFEEIIKKLHFTKYSR